MERVLARTSVQPRSRRAGAAVATAAAMLTLLAVAGLGGRLSPSPLAGDAPVGIHDGR